MINKKSFGLIFTKVIIHKFNLYNDKKPAEIKFTGKLIELFGKNGAGKSSILDAITFALYKKTSRTDKPGITMGDVCHNDGFVIVDFEKNGIKYSVKRFRKGATPNFGIDLYILHDDGHRDRINGNVNELTDKVQQIVGLDYKGFINTIAIRQNEVKMLAEDDSSKRGEAFEHIFQLGIFEKAKALASNLKKEYQNNIDTLDKRITELELISGNADQIKIDLKDKESSLNPLISDTNSLKSKIDTLNIEKQELVKKESEYHQLLGKKNTLQDTIQKLNTEKKSLKEIDKNEISNLEKIVSLTPDLKKKRDAMIKTQEFSSKIEDQTKEIEKEKKKYKIIISRLSTDSIKKCDPPEIVAERFKNNKATIDELRISFKYEFTNELRSGLKEDHEKNIEERNITIKDFTDQINTIIKTFKIEPTDTMQSIEKNIDICESSKDTLINSKSKIDVYEKEKSRIDSEINININQEKKITKLIDDLKNDHSYYNSIDTDIQKLNNQKNEVDTKISVINFEIESLKTKLKDAATNQAKIKILKDQQSQSVTYVNIYSKLQDQIFHSRGVPSYALSLLFNELQFKSSDIIYNLTKHREPEIDANGNSRRYQNISFKIKESESSRYGVDIEIDGKSINFFSGGEKTLISMAIRLAIAKQLAEMTETGTSIRMLFIDEGDIGSLDTETRDVYMDMIENCKDAFDKIVMVTHIRGLTESFDQTIHVLLNESGSSSIS